MESRIKIRPIFLGPCTLAVFFWCFFFTTLSVALQLSQYGSRMEYLGLSVIFFTGLLYPAASVIRRHCHAMACFQERLHSFQLASTKSSCCSTLPAGHFCDREVLRRCIRSWFGSEVNFENMCRSVLLESVASHLGPNLFPFQLYVVGACPVLWGLHDLALYHQLYGSTRTSSIRSRMPIYFVINSLGYFLGAGTVFVSTMSCLTRKWQQPMREQWKDVAINVMVVFVVFFEFGLMLLLAEFLDMLIVYLNYNQVWLSAAIWSCTLVLVGSAFWRQPSCSCGKMLRLDPFVSRLMSVRFSGFRWLRSSKLGPPFSRKSWASSKLGKHELRKIGEAKRFSFETLL